MDTPMTDPPKKAFLRPTLPPEPDAVRHFPTPAGAPFCGQTAPYGASFSSDPALVTCRRCIIAICRCDSQAELDSALVKADHREPRRVEGMGITAYYNAHPRTHIEDPYQEGWTRCSKQRRDDRFETVTDEAASTNPQEFDFCKSCLANRFAKPRTKKARAKAQGRVPDAS